MKLSIIQHPVLEPVSLTEAKNHLRIDHTEDDAAIGAMITAARQWVEQVTRRALVTQTLEVWFPKFARVLDLPRPPLQWVESVAYTAPDGTDDTVTTHRVIVPSESNGSVEQPDTGWPATIVAEDAVRIRYVAGYADTASPSAGVGNVPKPLKLAVLLVLGDLYEHREARLDAETYNNPTALALLAPYKEWAV